MTPVPALLRSAPWSTDAWLTDERARLVRNALLAVLPVTLLMWIATSSGGVDATGKVLGTDFVSFWSAARLAADGHATAVYDVAAHYAAQRAAFGQDVGYTAFFYPPPFLLLLLPLGLLGYFTALAVWLGTTGYAYWRAVRAWGGGWRGLPYAFLAYPALMINIGHGQNGFLTAALLGGGALLVGTRPLLGGMLLGALVIKPHLALLVPIALAAQGNLRGFVAAGVTAVALAAASALVLGPASWTGFVAVSPLAQAALHAGLVEGYKMQSLFAAVRLLGGGLTLAYVAQAALGLTVAGGLVVLARRRADARAQGAALVAGAMLATPFMLDYDLALAAVPMLWLKTRIDRTAALPFERAILAATFVLPLVARTIAHYTSVGPTPFVLAALFALIVRRGLWDRALVSQ